MAAQQTRSGPTNIERIGYRMLTECGALYLPQHTIGRKFCVDAYVPSKGLIVQFDGNYWHGHPAIYKTLTRRQATQRQRDIAQDAYLKACGYSVLRFWEVDMLKNQARVRAIMAKAVA